ncbi:MAG: tyrosine-protein phosphatase [Clostridiales bacterium]|jgi:protein-tyrosine phosphatase|nr:tyrosine-protein phosphatase [Clostridiales bacterium]
MLKNYVRLPLENAYNARDLGGYPCEGGVTAWRVFIRSDGLESLSAGDVRFLSEYGVKHVIDLRTPGELLAAPDPQALKSAMGYRNIPLMSGEVADATRAGVSLAEAPSDFLPEFYISLLRDGRDTIREIMGAMASAGNGGVVFHCAAGKDRTGVVAALLLGAAGVCREDILANYEVTHTYLRRNAAMMGSAEGYPPELMQSRASSLGRALGYIGTEHGGIPQYLLAAGVTRAQLGEIVGRFVAR